MIWHILRALSLVFAPWRLAATAIRTPTLLATILGLTACSLCIGMVLAARIVGGGEPFVSVGEYFFSLTWAAALFGGITFIVLAGLVLAALAFVAVARLIEFAGGRSGVRTRTSPESRVLLLAPLCGVMPVAMWAVCAALVYAAHPSFGIVGPAGKPSWVGWRGFVVIGSPYWLPVLIVAFLVLVVIATFRASRLVALNEVGRRCARCEYPLIGLPAGTVCPECGSTQIDSTETTPNPQSTEPLSIATPQRMR